MSNFAKRRIWKYFLVLRPEEKLKFSAWLGLELQDRQLSVQRLWQNLLCLDETEISLSSEGKFCIEKRLWNKIYPDEDFNDSRFRKLSEQLIRHIEEFLAIEGFRKDRTSKDLHLLRELGLRNSFQLIQTIYRKVKARLNRRVIRDENFFRDHTLFDREFQKNMAKIDYQVKFELSDFFQSFDKWRLTEEASNLIVHQIWPKEAPIPVVPADYFFDRLKNHPVYAQEPILHTYTLLFDLLTGKSEDFPTYFTFLKSYTNKINRETLKSLYAISTNYLVRKANKTRENIFYEQYADFLQWSLENELLYLNKILPVNSYKNLISINLILAKKTEGTTRQKRINLAKHYLESLKIRLPLNVREDAYSLNKAIYYFTIGEYNKVEASMGGRYYSNSGFIVQGRLYGLMARYELQEYTYLPTAIRSLKKYIIANTKKDLSSNHFKVYLDHLRFFNRLVNAYTTEDFTKLRKAIEKTPRVFEKNWLFEKIDEFFL
ncbi:MAG: hypothetical protein AAFR87_34925 [Bacteroidota bacterium]